MSTMAPVTTAPLRLPETDKSLSKIPRGIRGWLLAARLMVFASKLEDPRAFLVCCCGVGVKLRIHCRFRES
jgi:hypothetical protein